MIFNLEPEHNKTTHRFCKKTLRILQIQSSFSLIVHVRCLTPSSSFAGSRVNRYAVSEQGLVLEGKSLLPSLPCAHRRVHTDGVQVVDVEEMDSSKAERDELAKAFFWSTSTQSYVAVVLVEVEGCEFSDVHFPPLTLYTYTTQGV